MPPHLFHYLVYLQAAGVVLSAISLAAFVWGPKPYRPVAMAVMFASLAFGGVIQVIHHRRQTSIDEQRDALNQDLDALSRRVDAVTIKLKATTDPKAQAALASQMKDIAKELANDRKRLDDVKRIEAEEL